MTCSTESVHGHWSSHSPAPCLIACILRWRSDRVQCFAWTTMMPYPPHALRNRHDRGSHSPNLTTNQQLMCWHDGGSTTTYGQRLYVTKHPLLGGFVT